MSQWDDPGAGTAPLSDRARELRYRRFRVTVSAGPGKGTACTSDGPELCVGSAEGNDLVLGDATVSRHHFALEATPRGFVLRDLGSTNGTWLAGARIREACLTRRTTLEVGRAKLSFEPLDDVVIEPLSGEDAFGGALGQSPAMRRIFAMLERVAAAEANVLLEGETGSGKTLLADAIHQRSRRAGRPFLVVDCGALAPSLIESELFGHARGAFTGAHEARRGAFEVADGGTLLLDEVGELPLETQPKLLRVLEDGRIRPVGLTSERGVDVRVIAATNRDLREEVNRGSFRADLYYRLNAVRIRVPPLRERPEDVPLLVQHFYAQFAEAGGEPPPELLDAFARLTWSGNVRELRNAVERAVLLDDAPGLADESPAKMHPAVSFRAAKEEAVASWERRYLAELLGRHGGNLSHAARTARMDRNHLRELLRRHRLLGD